MAFCTVRILGGTDVNSTMSNDEFEVQNLKITIRAEWELVAESFVA